MQSKFCLSPVVICLALPIGLIAKIARTLCGTHLRFLYQLPSPVSPVATTDASPPAATTQTAPDAEHEETSTPTWPVLRTATLCLSFEAQGAVVLPSPATNAWRGPLGAYLRRLSSEAERKRGEGIYQELFRTPAIAVTLPEDLSGRTLGALGLAGDHVPHPFVLRVPEASPTRALRLAPGEQVAVEMVLVEDAIAHVPALCAAFEAIAGEGIGARAAQPSGKKRKGHLRLCAGHLAVEGVQISLREDGCWSLPPVCDASLYDRASALGGSAPPSPATPGEQEAKPVTVELRTPLRLKHRGDYLAPGTLSAEGLAAGISRRVLGLAACYGPTPPGEAQVQACRDAARALAERTTLERGDDLRWAKRSRYSRRQSARHTASGLLGRFALRAAPADAARWRQLLRRAEALHLGKGSSLGQGHVARSAA